MKWLFLAGAVYVILIYNAPDSCDVKTLRHCSKEDIHKIHYFKKRSKDELRLLLEMEETEMELISQQFIENLVKLRRDVDDLNIRAMGLKDSYENEVKNYDKKRKYVRSVYSSNIIRRLLSLEPDKSEDTQTLQEM